MRTRPALFEIGGTAAKLGAQIIVVSAILAALLGIWRVPVAQADDGVTSQSPQVEISYPPIEPTEKDVVSNPSEQADWWKSLGVDPSHYGPCLDMKPLLVCIRVELPASEWPDSQVIPPVGGESAVLDSVGNTANDASTSDATLTPSPATIWPPTPVVFNFADFLRGFMSRVVQLISGMLTGLW